MTLTPDAIIQILSATLLASTITIIHLFHKLNEAKAALTGYKDGLLAALEKQGVNVAATANAGKVVRKKKGEN